MDWVRKHTESFPVVVGLGADPNIMRMYQLYVEQCKGKYREWKWSVMLFIGNFSMRSIISHSMSQRKINVHYVSMQFRKEDTNGGKINWLQIRWLRYMEEKPDCILFKYKFEDEFREMKVSMSNKRGQPSEPYQLAKYTSRQANTAAKKKDLGGLCKNGIISSEYHEYYKFLPANNRVIDTTVDTDVEEEKIDSDQD